MGNIIPWPKPGARPPRPAPATDGSRGEVLLFLGIRYERHEDGAGHPPLPRLGGKSAIKPDRGPGRRKRG